MSPAVSKVEEYPVESASLWFDAWRRFRRNRAALASAILVVAVILVSLLGPWLVYLYNGFEYDTLGLDNRLANPSLKHLLGTDTLGRDLLARVLYGSRISLMVGLVSTLISLLIGVAYGAMAGYVGGRFDELLMRAVDVLYSLPDILLIVILMALFERSLLLLFIALGATSWLTMARIVRGQVLSLKHEQFVEAARCIGAYDSVGNSRRGFPQFPWSGGATARVVLGRARRGRRRGNLGPSDSADCSGHAHGRHPHVPELSW
jgi:oligopeptide transport system permease protein